MGKDPIAAELGRRGGRKGGRARALSLTPEQRREIAQRAAAARWQRPAEDAAPGSFTHTPMVGARGAADVDGLKLEAFVLEDGRRLVGLLSAALALDEDAEDLARDAGAVVDGGVVTFHVPGDWRLMRGLTPATLLEVCRRQVEAALTGPLDRAARGKALRAVGILAAAARDGLPGLMDAAARPVMAPAAAIPA